MYRRDRHTFYSFYSSIASYTENTRFATRFRSFALSSKEPITRGRWLINRAHSQKIQIVQLQTVRLEI